MNRKALLAVSLVGLLAPALSLAEAPAAPAAPAAPGAAAAKPEPPPLAPAQPGAPAAATAERVSLQVAKVGDALPAGTFVDLETKKDVKAQEVFGKGVAVVVVMQTACAQCKQEVQFVQKVADNKDFAGKFTPYAIVVDVNPGERVAKFKEDAKLKMDFLSDANFTYPPMIGIDVTPAMFIVKDGKISFVKMGFSGNAGQQILDELKKLL